MLHYSEQSLLTAPSLIRKSNGQLYYFFLNEEKKLLYRCTQDDTKSWSPPNLCFEKIRDYAVVIDGDDHIHLVATTIDGKLLSQQISKKEQKAELLYFDKRKRLSHCFLRTHNKIVHLVYLALDQEENRWWLMYHRFEENKWSESQAIDFGNGAGLNYAVPAIDLEGKLHLVCRILETSGYQLYWRHLQRSNPYWSQPLKLTRPNTNNHFPSLIIDQSFCIHLCWTVFDGKSYRVHYRRQTQGGWPGGRWSKEIILSSPDKNMLIPTLFSSKKELAIIWQQAGKFFKYRFLHGGSERRTKVDYIDISPFGKKNYRLLRWSDNESTAAIEGKEEEKFFWTYGTGEPPAELLSAFDSFAMDMNNNSEQNDESALYAHFQDLRNYSDNLVQRATALSKTKLELEKTVHEKSQEFLLLSHHHRRQHQDLENKLRERNKDLENLETNFNHTLNKLRERIQSIRHIKEEELEKAKKEANMYEEILKEKGAELKKVKITLEKSRTEAKQVTTENLALKKRIRELKKEIEENKVGVWEHLTRKLHIKP